MRRLFLCALIPLAVACAQGDAGAVGGLGEGGRVGGTTAASGAGAGSASSSTSTSTSAAATTGAGTSSGGGTVPTTCSQADGSIGCCLGAETLYYCKTGSTTVTKKACSSGDVCGWSPSKSYYDCVASPGGTDPGGMYPEGCP